MISYIINLLFKKYFLYNKNVIIKFIIKYFFEKNILIIIIKGYK